MKVIVIKSNLKDGFSIIERASGDNLNLPVLKYALVDSDGEKIKITATNLEIAISYFVSGKIIEKGRVGIPISIFNNLLNNIQTERLNIEKRGGKIEVITDNYKASLQTIPVDDFPIIPTLKNNTKFIEISGLDLKESIQKVIIATQFSELRPELNSILFDYAIDAIKLVATDSFRLAERVIQRTQFKSNIEDGFKVLIPLKTAQELIRILKDDEVVSIYNDENQILFKTENFELISRLIDGNFPDYTAIIPKNFSSEAVVDREEFMKAIKLTGVFSGATNEVKIKILEKGRVMEIYSGSSDVGENNYALPIKSNNEVEEVGFNWRYIVDVIKVLETPEMFVGFGEDNKPTMIKSPNEASYFYILMPILRA
jgi:DNA polymerase-3 subunit beta